MIIPLLNAVQKWGRKQPSHVVARHHLMLTGINQTLFLKDWGDPEARIPLKRLGGFYRQQAIYLVAHSDDQVDYSIWIYRKKDRILFFIRKRLIAHFKWSAFKAGTDSLNGGIHTKAVKIPAPLIAQTLALVA
jgi:hypothetical protein